MRPPEDARILVVIGVSPSQLHLMALPEPSNLLKVIIWLGYTLKTSHGGVQAECLKLMGSPDGRVQNCRFQYLEVDARMAI